MAEGEILRRLDAHLERGNEHMRRGNELMEEIREEGRLNREQAERTRRTMDAIAENNRTLLRDLTAEIHTMREESRRHFEASIGALTDLAAEIRSWGGGAAPA